MVREIHEGVYSIFERIHMMEVRLGRTGGETDPQFLRGNEGERGTKVRNLLVDEVIYILIFYKY